MTAPQETPADMNYEGHYVWFGMRWGDLKVLIHTKLLEVWTLVHTVLFITFPGLCIGRKSLIKGFCL